MACISKKQLLYDFTVDIYLLKECIKGNKEFSEIYAGAVKEIKGILNKEISFYDVNERTFDIVSLASTKYPSEFRKSNGNSDLIKLLNILEENNGKQKFNSFN